MPSQGSFGLGRVLSLVLLLIGVHAAQAETVTFVARFAGEHAMGMPEATASITLTPAPPDTRDAKSLDVPVPGRVQVELSSDVKWNLEPTGSHFWTRSLMIDPAQGLTYYLDIYPAGVVTGQLRGDRGDLPRGDLTVGFAAAGEMFPLAPQTSRCRTAESGQFTCTVPLGTYDLRFKAAQRAPVYRWSHKVDCTSDVGALVLRRGGTISGYVAAADLPAEDEDLRIHVERVAADGGASSEQSVAPITANIGPAGFFYTPVLAPGAYDLLIEAGDRGVAAVGGLRVRDGLEARLPRPLTLEPRVPITITVAPPRPPLGASWQLDLLRAGPEGVRPAARGTIQPDGTFTAENLVAGEYHVVIRDDRGSRWAAQSLDVSPSARHFTVQVPVIDVEGTLRRGSEPVKGSLWFGGQHGTPSISFESDEQGVFRGMLPRVGEWTVDVLLPPNEDVLGVSAVVTLDDETSLAHVDVVIPDTLFQGVVVDGGGNPVRGAAVAFNRGPLRLAVTNTDARGEFAVRGLTAGPADVVASASGARSSVVKVTVDGDDPNPPLRLVLQKIPALKSRIVGPAGPVPGARVVIWSEGGGQVSMTIADSEGYFTAMGQPSTERQFVGVHSPGLALLLAPLPEDPANMPPQYAMSAISGTIDVKGESPLSHLEYGTVVIPLPLAIRLLAPAAEWSPDMSSARLRELPPGRYRVCTQKPPPAPCATGWLAPGATLQLDTRH